MEPKEQEAPNSDAVEVKNKKRKRGESEASENVKEKKLQLKKKKRRQKRKKAEKVANGKSKEEGLDHSESGSTGMQLVVKADESIKKTKRRRKRKKATKVANGKSKEEGLDHSESGSTGMQLVVKADESIKKKKRRRKRKKCKNVSIGKSKEEGLDHNESGTTGLQLVLKADESIIRKNVAPSLNIYVGGIPYYSTEDDIRSYFENFGTITSIDCMTFPDSGMCRGIAIITYKTEAAAKRALAIDGLDLGGLFLKIQPYKTATVEKLPKFSSSVVDGYNSIYIDNLSWDTTEDDIWKLFSDCAVASIRLQFGEDKEMGEFKGYAHVDFADGLSLHTALKLDQSILYGRPVRISCAVPMKATGTQLVHLPKDNQEDSGNKGKTYELEAISKDNEIDNNNVIENQVTRSRANVVSSKIRRRTYSFGSKTRRRKCHRCKEYGHLRSACLKKLAANSTITGQMIVFSEKGTGATLIPLPQDNQEDSGKKGNTTKLEATPRDDKVDRSNVSVVVENQITSSGTNAPGSKIRWRTYFVSSMIRWRICYRCRKYGHLSSLCPKKLAANSTIPGQMIVSSEKGTGATLIPLPKDNQEDSGKKGNTTKLEATPRDDNVDRSNVSVFLENQVTNCGTNALSSKIWWRTYFVSSKIRLRICYRCREYGHLSSSCPKKLAANSTIPGQMIVSEKGTEAMLISLPKDNQEDSMKKENTTKLEATSKDDNIDQSNDSVFVQNQDTSSGTNALNSKIWWRTYCVSSKMRWRICYRCRKYGHLSSSCPKKLASDSSNPGQMIVSSENGTEAMLISLPKDNQEDRGKKENTTKLEATPKDDKIDRSNVSVFVENQDTSSGTNALNSKVWWRTYCDRSNIRWRICYRCREYGHLSSSCPKKLASDSTTPGNHLCGTALISLPEDNQEDSGKKEKSTKLEATPRDDKVDRSNVSVVVENQVTSSGKNSLPSKIWKRKCFECKQRGHLLSSCPKKLAADSTNPVDNQDDNGKKRNFTEFEATPRDNEVDGNNVSVVVENQVTGSVTNAPSSKRRKRTSYKCREHGHLSSSCPNRLAADSTNPVTTEKLLPIHGRGCTSTVDSMLVGKTSIQIPVRSTLVRWLLPPNPWIKLNTDGSFDSNTGLASGGGLIRDHFGDLQLAFFTPLKATSSSDAELQALLHGLHLARHFNRPIWIELDALEIVLLLKSGRPGALQIQHTLSQVRVLMAQIQTWITHIFREGNQPADYMATMGFGSHTLNLVYPHLAPKYFLELVRMDQIGYPSFRVR